MKTTMICLSLLVSFAAQAKVQDFNSLIDENVAAQRELYKEVKTRTEETRTALNPVEVEEKNTVIVGTPNEPVNVPTNKNFLRFSKETVNHQAESKELEDRVANEFKSVDMEF